MVLVAPRAARLTYNLKHSGVIRIRDEDDVSTTAVLDRHGETDIENGKVDLRENTILVRQFLCAYDFRIGHHAWSIPNLPKQTVLANRSSAGWPLW